MRTGKGFTLIEMVMVIVVVSILAGIAALVLREGFASYTTAQPIIPIAGKVNIAVDNLAREVRSAESVTSASATALTFVNQQGETIVINKSGANLTRSVNGGGAQTLCNSVTALTFAYFDAAFATTATTANVRFMTIAITVTDRNVPYSLMAGVEIRKLL